MDGKLLVLCDERPTINSHRERIDEEGNLLREGKGEFYKLNNEIVDVDIHKEIISGMELLNNIRTPATDSSESLFVDWETVVPSNLKSIQEMIRLSRNQEIIPFKNRLFEGKSKNLTEKAYSEILLELDGTSNRPCGDYVYRSAGRFLQLFTKAVYRNGIIAILPAFSRRDSDEIKRARLLNINTWKENNDIISTYR